MKNLLFSHYLKALMMLCLVQWASAQSVTPSKNSYTEGENFTVAFAGGPGNTSDWIAIYPQGVVPSGNPAASLWFYTNGTKSSGGNLTAGNVSFNNTLAVGNYSVWFLSNNGYTVLAGPSNFSVTDALATDPPSWLVTTFKRRHAVVGTAYTGKISAYTNSKNYLFSKVAGPAWLNVSATGELTGTPQAGAEGVNEFTVRASNGSNTADATLQIEVFAPNTEIVSKVKVMSCNAWHGWGQINNGHRKGLDAVILSGADIIGMQETTDNVSGSGIYQAQKVAEDLGWYYRSNISGSLGLISRYPITDQTLQAGIARGIKVRVTSSPLQEMILMNCHLDFTEYGPYAAQLSGATEASVLAEENSSSRDEQITAIMQGMATLLGNADDIPVLLTGDFNAPSHLDWTAATAASHGNVGSVAWPTSTTVINAGMVDSYREVHSNPVTTPGNSWSPFFKGSEPQDRIDFVYYKGTSLKPEKSELFTTAVEQTVGAWGANITPLKNNTWPSDHASVITTFRLKPVDADGDGLSDAFENKHFGNTSSQAGAGDADSDGASNANEQAQGTDPNKATLFPSTSISLGSGSPLRPVVSFSLSQLAIDGDLICERSYDLSSWQFVWSYKTDPELASALVSTQQLETRKWEVTVTDAAVDALLKDEVFYRVRLGN